MLIQTTRGPIDDSELEVERVEVDDAQMFAVDFRYRRLGAPFMDGEVSRRGPTDPEVICTMRQVKIWKFNPLTEITTTQGIMKRDELDISVVITDTPNEYTQA